MHPIKQKLLMEIIFLSTWWNTSKNSWSKCFGLALEKLICRSVQSDVFSRQVPSLERLHCTCTPAIVLVTNCKIFCIFSSAFCNFTLFTLLHQIDYTLRAWSGIYFSKNLNLQAHNNLFTKPNVSSLKSHFSLRVIQHLKARQLLIFNPPNLIRNPFFLSWLGFVPR